MNLLMKHDWNNIRVFAAVAQCQSLTHAGQLLGLNASTVMRRIEQFEHQCNVRLFERRSTGYRLTINGEAIFTKLTCVTDKLNAFESFLQERKKADADKLNVLIDPCLFPMLSKHLSTLKGTRTSAEVNIVLGKDLTTLDSAANQLALVVSNAPPLHLVGTKHGPCKFKLYGAKNYVNQHIFEDHMLKDHILKDSQQMCLVSSQEHLGYPQIKQITEQFSGAKIECTSSANQLMAISDGLGIGWLPEHLSRQASDLVCINEQEIIVGDIWLLFHPEHKNNGLMNNISKTIKAWL